MIMKKSGQSPPAPESFMAAFRAMPLIDRQVLLLANAGYSYKQIANAMDVSVPVVMSHGYLALNVLRIPKPR